MIITLIQERYGDVINKADFIFMSGGGSYMFSDIAGNIAIDDFEPGFFRLPKSNNEFYNAIGYAIWGDKRATDIRTQTPNTIQKTKKG